MKLSQLFKKHKKNVLNVVLILGLLLIVVVLFRYNTEKSSLKDNMLGNNKLSPNSKVLEEILPQPKGQSQESVGASPLSTLEKSNFLPVTGISTTKGGSKSCNSQKVIDPKELLPNDSNSEWAKINPASTDLKNMNMLSSGHHIGINTVGSSLRNANLQVRSEPAIPQVDVGPWNNTTIETDTLRRPLEIGGGD